MPWVTRMRHILYFIAAYQTYWTNCLFVVSEQVSATKSILSAKNWISTQFSENCAFFVKHICSCFWLRIVIVLFTSRWQRWHQICSFSNEPKIVVKKFQETYNECSKDWLECRLSAHLRKHNAAWRLRKDLCKPIGNFQILAFEVQNTSHLPNWSCIEAYMKPCFCLCTTCDIARTHKLTNQSKDK